MGCEGPAALGRLLRLRARVFGAWHSPFGEGRARSRFPGAPDGLGTAVHTVGPGRDGRPGIAAAARGWDAAQHGIGTRARLPRWLTPKTSARQAHFFQAYLSYGAAGPGAGVAGTLAGLARRYGRLNPGSVAAPARPAAVAHLGKARAVPGAGGGRTWGWGGPACPPCCCRHRSGRGWGAVFHPSRFCPDRSPSPPADAVSTFPPPSPSK